jgi:hypothetical protein
VANRALAREVGYHAKSWVIYLTRKDIFKNRSDAATMLPLWL